MHSSGPSMIFQTGAASPSSSVGGLTASSPSSFDLMKAASVSAKMTPGSPTPQQQVENSRLALIYCTLLALQFGLQPLLASKFTSGQVSKASVVIATELTKIWIATIFILMGPSRERKEIFEKWTLMDSLKIAALPAVMYAIQNLLVQYAYKMLDSMTFNLLNQTKTLSAAFWLYLIMGKTQTPIQIVALLLLLVAAVVLNLGGSSSEGNVKGVAEYQLGLIMVIGASMLSGLSAALTQRALVGSAPRHALFFSAELAVYGILFLVVHMHFSANGRDELQMGLLNGWDFKTLIPVVSNAFGGVVVGLVTKYAGGVVKGFALIAGIIITAFAQYLLDNKPIGTNHWIAVALVSLSIYLHTKPPGQRKQTGGVEKSKKD